jgi:hypothetical protein
MSDGACSSIDEASYEDACGQMAQRTRVEAETERVRYPHISYNGSGAPDAF